MSKKKLIERALRKGGDIADIAEQYSTSKSYVYMIKAGLEDVEPVAAPKRTRRAQEEAETTTAAESTTEPVEAQYLALSEGGERREAPTLDEALDLLSRLGGGALYQRVPVRFEMRACLDSHDSPAL